MKYVGSPFVLLILSCLPLVSQARENTVSVVPFQLIGNSIFVKGSVNGTSGNFLLDTGSPNLLLNGKYFQGVRQYSSSLSIVDIHGQRESVTFCVVKELRIADHPLEESHGMVTDLSALEQAKGISIAGIIGYSSLRKIQIIFDFDDWVLWLVPLDRKGNPKVKIETFKMVEDLKLRMSGHISYITASYNGKKLRLGIDSGSEVNMLHRKWVMRNRSNFIVTGHTIVRGLANAHLPCGIGTAKNIQLQPGNNTSLEVVLADMGFLNECLGVSLHGLLGAPFLMQGKVAINFKKKRLYLGQTLEEGFARQTAIANERNLVSTDK